MQEVAYLSPDDYRIAEENGISYQRAYERFYKSGWSREETISRPIGKQSLWREYQVICEENGITYQCFHNRVKRGIDPEEASRLPKCKTQFLFKEIKVTPEVVRIAEENGISEKTLKMRVYRYRWDVERAMSEPVNEKFRRKG